MNNIPDDSVLLKSKAPFIAIIVSVASVTYRFAILAQDWYRFRKSGTAMDRKAWYAIKMRQCKEIWEKFLILIRLRKPQPQNQSMKLQKIGC